MSERQGKLILSLEFPSRTREKQRARRSGKSAVHTAAAAAITIYMRKCIWISPYHTFRDNMKCVRVCMCVDGWINVYTANSSSYFLVPLFKLSKYREIYILFKLKSSHIFAARAGWRDRERDLGTTYFTVLCCEFVM